jgi:aminoglycoside phosphotransferase (APT) family kinase protein
LIRTCLLSVRGTMFPINFRNWPIATQIDVDSVHEQRRTHKARLPGVPDFQFTAVELVQKGWDHDVLILDEKYVFRFAKDELDNSSFQREMRFLADFGNISNLPVPRYKWVSKNGSFGGYEIILGEALLPEAYAKFSDEKRLNPRGRVSPRF